VSVTSDEERIRLVMSEMLAVDPGPEAFVDPSEIRKAGGWRWRLRIDVKVVVAVAAIAILVATLVLAGPLRPGQNKQRTAVSIPPATTLPPSTSSSVATTLPARTSTTITTTPEQTLPPLNLETLPVPSGYACPAGLYSLSSANPATGECVPYAYLVGGTGSNPNNNTACPAGSSMTMGPVECNVPTGIVTAVPPGPNTCSTPGGPCPSSTLPLAPQASVLTWSAIQFPTANCPDGYYFGETDGSATCVPYGYLPGGTSASPNNNTACPAGSGLAAKPQLTGTLCTQDAEPYDIVAPVPSAS
jgi:hypothetical protein